VIGVKIGDGYASRRKRVIKGYNRVRIGLEVKDREFATGVRAMSGKGTGKEANKPKIQK
jgi:hypothetical protein